MSGITTCPKCGANLRGSEQIQDRISVCPHCKAPLTSPPFDLSLDELDRNLDVRRKTPDPLIPLVLLLMCLPLVLMIFLFAVCIALR
jgi:hypothetical protein